MELGWAGIVAPRYGKNCLVAWSCEGKKWGLEGLSFESIGWNLISTWLDQVVHLLTSLQDSWRQPWKVEWKLFSKLETVMEKLKRISIQIRNCFYVNIVNWDCRIFAQDGISKQSQVKNLNSRCYAYNSLHLRKIRKELGSRLWGLLSHEFVSSYKIKGIAQTFPLLAN